MARLDRLGSAKEVAQIGAAIGREFSHALLSAVVSKPEAAVSIGARPPHCTLACCSGKACRRMQPTCSSMPWCKTRPMARCCASRDVRFTLASPKPWKRQFSEIAESQPELLARHCAEAGLIEKAADLWGKAGQRSLQRSAAVEAVGAVNTCCQPSRAFAIQPCTASPGDHLPSRAGKCSDAHKRLCSVRNPVGASIRRAY